MIDEFLLGSDDANSNGNNRKMKPVGKSPEDTAVVGLVQKGKKASVVLAKNKLQ